MTKLCKECHRPLKVNETELCPNCKSEKHSKFKKIGEVVIAVIIAIGTVVAYGNKNNKESI